MAKEGDWVVGTGGKSHRSAGNGKLIYAMRVTTTIPLSRYLTSPKYSRRADRFPEIPYRQSRVALISEEFWYFGRNAINIALVPNRHLTDGLEKRGPNYRADFSPAFIDDFANWIRETYRQGIHGEPCDGTPAHWGPRRCGRRPPKRVVC